MHMLKGAGILGSKTILLAFLLIIISHSATAQVDSDFSLGGGVMVGSSTTGCNASYKGTITYNSTNNVMQYCNGSTWTYFDLSPSAETIAAGATVTANACGGLKKVTSTAARVTDTTNTFTASSTSYDGCCMDVMNTGTFTITLDQNAKFKTSGGADVSLVAGGIVRVCSNGTNWYQTTAVLTPS